MKCSICGVSDVYSDDSTGPLIGNNKRKRTDAMMDDVCTG